MIILVIVYTIWYDISIEIISISENVVNFNF